MRAVLQRVTEASVRVDAQTVGQVGIGWLVLLGVARGDSDDDALWMAEKIVGLRGFPDEEGKMNLDARQADGGILLVSQFTLLGDCRKGRRPGFDAAAPPEAAERLYLRVADHLRNAGLPVATGVFQAHMEIRLVNDGPVTFLLDSKKQF